MIVMPSNNCKWQVHYWQGVYGGLGHLYSIGGFRGPYPHLPYALDNGRFPAWSSGKEWSEADYLKLLDKASGAARAPMWALVPDVVGDRPGTLREWAEWAPRLRTRGWPLAFAAQDGMTPDDVPDDADVVFLGGTTEWKQSVIVPWCARFARVHVGRVNTPDMLRYCSEAGAEPCDGTGWFRDPTRTKRIGGLERFLREQSERVAIHRMLAPFETDQ